MSPLMIEAVTRYIDDERLSKAPSDREYQYYRDLFNENPAEAYAYLKMVIGRINLAQLLELQRSKKLPIFEPV